MKPAMAARNNKRRRAPKPERRTLWATDGCFAAGRTEQRGKKFAAFDSNRRPVGTFKSVLKAMRAIPSIIDG